MYSEGNLENIQMQAHNFLWYMHKVYMYIRYCSNTMVINYYGYQMLRYLHHCHHHRRRSCHCFFLVLALLSILTATNQPDVVSRPNRLAYMEKYEQRIL